MRTKNYRHCVALLRLVSSSIVMSTACAPPPSFRASDDHAGAVTFALGVAPGLTLDSATYTITAPGFTRNGSLDLRQSTELSATIGGLPAGDGYLLAVAATLSDGATTCAGSRSFAVTEGAMTSLSIHLLCREPPRTGGVQVSGTVNICPLVDAVSANPAEVRVGGKIALAAAAHDTDNAPAPLALQWSASSGGISDAAVAAPTFTCTSAGVATVTLTATDGDCSDALTLTVTCTPPPAIVINEIESNGGVPGDWTELYNAGPRVVDLSGWIFRDNDDSHGYSIPAGTTIAGRGYFLLEEAAFGFGLGAADAARLYDASGILIDAYNWTAHAAATTYGRCPSGVGAFATTVSVTKGGANDCGALPPDGGGTGGVGGLTDGGVASDGGAGGAGGGGTVDGGVAALPWPGANRVALVDSVGQFTGNLSGLCYDPATPAGLSVLWAVQNGPSTLYRLLWNGVTWASATSDDWTAGKALHYPGGTGAPDSEGVTRAEADSPMVYVSTERDNDANTISRLSVLRFDTSAPGPALSATHEWDLTASLPVAGANLGLEAITWIPDRFLAAAGFVDESTGRAYDPAAYPNHGSGIFFVGLEANGAVYGFALDHADGGFQRVATFPGGQSSVMDLSFDRDTGYLWAACDNTCGNRAAVLQIDGDPSSPARGRFGVSRFFDRPSTLPDVNNEGIAIAPESECTNGSKAFFWSDDGATAGNSLRRDAIPCGRFF
ncbi:MAG TPA: lamin tail domain-containing protein [Polyangia bacterium]|nr:lamin tail domain-containing protein [Polyangia bacterium]